MFRSVTVTSIVALFCVAVPSLAQLPYDETNHLDFDSGFPVGPYDASSLAELEADASAGCVALDTGTINAPCHSAPARDGTSAQPVAQPTDTVMPVTSDPDADPKEAMSLTFLFHIDEGLAEQDVFHEPVPGSGEVFRPTGATREMAAPLFAPADAVPHTPLQTENIGPWPRGKALGITLGEWFAAKGEGNYVCEDGTGHVDIRFRNLVPNGLYTMWHDFAIWPPTEPFIGFYDTPFGARDGSENAFTADAEGSAHFVRTITPCLQLSGEQLISELAIAWHSDGHTWGYTPGEFSTDTHVHLYVPLPTRAGL